MGMILPNHHDITNDLYEKFYGKFTYDSYEDGGHVTRCKICGAKVTHAGDEFGGIVRCSESGVVLFDY